MEFRHPLKTSSSLHKVVAALRDAVPRLESDGYLAGEVAAAAEMTSAGSVVGATENNTILDISGGNWDIRSSGN